MIRSRTTKDEDFSEENLIGKHIVDPNGDIIGKCVGVFEDDKKKLKLKISVKTEIDSNFIVEETIPVNMIKQIGEVILLKKSFEIKQIPAEDLISIEIIEETESEKEAKEEEMSKEKVNEKKEDNRELEATKIKIPDEEKKAQKKKNIKKKLNFDVELGKILQVTKQEEKDLLINNFISEFYEEISTKKTFLKKIFQSSMTTDNNTRMIAAELLEEITEKSTKIILPFFIDGLKATYNEPSKQIEQKLINSFSKIASIQKDEFKANSYSIFFDDLLVKRKYCKNISLNRIHNINLKIFINNFHSQEYLVKIYLNEILKDSENAKEYAELLKDYNALIIAYTIIQHYNPETWQKKILKSKYIQNTYDTAFLESINNILEIFSTGNLKQLNEIFDLKLGVYFSNRIIAKLIKNSIRDALSNVSILPLEILSSFYSDDENRIVKIIFDLINQQEIDVQVVFIENKTYITSK